MTPNRFDVPCAELAKLAATASSRSAALRAVPVRQPHDPDRAVVALVRLEEEVARVDAHHEGEAAAQAADVDPLAVVFGRVDVRPADRGAEADALAARVLAAGWVDAVARRAPHRPRALQVAEAVEDLRSLPHPLQRPASLVERPDLHAERVLDLPVRAAPAVADAEEVDAGLGAEDANAAAHLVDRLVGAHPVALVAARPQLHRAATARADVVAGVQEDAAPVAVAAAAPLDVEVEGRPDPEVGTEQLAGPRAIAGIRRRGGGGGRAGRRRRVAREQRQGGAGGRQSR